MDKEKGFTLVELLIVVAIIGILASLVIVSLTTNKAKSRDARRISDLRQVGNVLHQYNTDNQEFPSSLSDLVPDYMGGVPTDPIVGGDPYTYNSSDCSSPQQAFVLRTELETEHNALETDVDGSVCGVNCADPYYCIDQ